jgi:hypothetical protein
MNQRSRGGSRANGLAPSGTMHAKHIRNPACCCPLPRFGQIYEGPLCQICLGYATFAEGSELCRKLHDAEGQE